jgi:hypothetical protein
LKKSEANTRISCEDPKYRGIHTATVKCRNANPEHYTVVRGTDCIRKESKKEFVPLQAVEAYEEAMTV